MHFADLSYFAKNMQIMLIWKIFSETTEPI